MEFIELYNDNGFLETARYPLDPGSVDMKSLSKDRIVLRYTGELPLDYYGMMNPRIVITPHIAERPSIGFLVEDRNEDMPPDEPWKELHFRVEATTDEIETLLSKFFQQGRKNNGLSTAAELEFYKRFDSWRNLVMNAPHILCIISEMSPEDIAYIARELQSKAE